MSGAPNNVGQVAIPIAACQSDADGRLRSESQPALRAAEQPGADASGSVRAPAGGSGAFNSEARPDLIGVRVANWLGALISAARGNWPAHTIFLVPGEFYPHTDQITRLLHTEGLRFEISPRVIDAKLILRIGPPAHGERRRGDTETRRDGDAETRRHGDAEKDAPPSPRVPASPRLPVSPSEGPA